MESGKALHSYSPVDEYITNSYNTDKGRRKIPCWLQVSSQTCYSEAQLRSGNDLSKIKKKYKQMKCVYCERYNPATPWAKTKSRKFEYENLVDHERSLNHIKAHKMLLRDCQGGTMMVQHLSQKINENSVFPSELSAPRTYTWFKPFSTSNVPNPQHQYNNSGSSSNQYLSQDNNFSKQEVLIQTNSDVEANKLKAFEPLLINTNHSSLTESNQMHYDNSSSVKQISSSKFADQVLGYRNKSTANHISNIISEAAHPDSKSKEDPNTADHSKKCKIKSTPAWLKLSGKMCHSNKQLERGDVHRGVKKKYKWMVCETCERWNNKSPWAQLKARKFEMNIILEHAKSQSHQAALMAARSESNNKMEIFHSVVPTSSEGQAESVHPVSGNGQILLSTVTGKVGMDPVDRNGQMGIVEDITMMNDEVSSQSKRRKLSAVGVSEAEYLELNDWTNRMNDGNLIDNRQRSDSIYDHHHHGDHPSDEMTVDREKNQTGEAVSGSNACNDHSDPRTASETWSNRPLHQLLPVPHVSCSMGPTEDEGAMNLDVDAVTEILKSFLEHPMYD